MELKDINIGAELIHDTYGKCRITDIDSDGEIFFTEIESKRHSTTYLHEYFSLPVTQKMGVFEIPKKTEKESYDKNKHSLNFGDVVSINDKELTLSKSNFAEGFIYLNGKWTKVQDLNLKVGKKTKKISNFGIFSAEF